MKFKIFSPSKGLDRLCNGTRLTLTPRVHAETYVITAGDTAKKTSTTNPAGREYQNVNTFNGMQASAFCRGEESEAP